MKRLLLTIICCSPFVFYPSISLALDLTGPNDEQAVSYQQYGPISAVETLWGISTKLRPNRSVSVQQTLLAIYKINPYVFNQGNINKLIPESMITVPVLEFIQSQTDKEASALIAAYSQQKRVTRINKKTPSVTADKKTSQPQINADLLAEQNTALLKNKLAGQKALELEQKKLQTLHKELDLSHEQLILSTEENQVLKLKLQPLRDELALVNGQLESVLATQEKQQNIIDDYRAQLDAVKALPFSGGGGINEILRWITGSLANLLIVIISPILLLTACFAVLLRIRAKRLLAVQEQELAESTAMLMEESGQYDSLLSENIYDEREPEVDFTIDESLDQALDNDEFAASSSDLDSLQSIQQTESPDSINLEDPADAIVEMADAEETANTADDPFGIAALAEEEDLISSTDLDDPFGITALAEEEELISGTDLDDPFGVAALAEEEELISGADLDDPFGISALAEEEDLISSADLNDSEALSAAQQADQDLASQWESQISAKSEDLQAELSNVVDIAGAAQPEVPAADLDITGSQPAEAFALEEIVQAEESAGPELTATDLQFAEIEALAEHTDDSLAKKLSDVAFNGDVPLPKVKAEQADDFIDIETLLGNNAEANNVEPYEEIDFDLDLNNFPDVVNAEQGVDIDDDENGVSAQLDLARAYLEIDDKAGAKEILLTIADTDNSAQRTEVEKLLSRLA